MSKPDPLARALVDASFELHRRRLWLEFPADAPFLIRVADEPYPIVASIIGHAGNDYGLVLMRDPDAFPRIVRALRDGDERRSDREEASVLSVAMDALGQIPVDIRKVLDAAGFHARREALAPFILSKPSGEAPRATSRAEQRLLLTCLRGVMSAQETGELAPFSLDTRRQRIQQLTIEGDWREPKTQVQVVPWPQPVPTGSAAPRRLLDVDHDIPLRAERWIAGLLPGFVTELHPGEHTAVFAVLDETNDRLLAMKLIDPDQIEDIVDALSDAMNGVSHEFGARRPREIVFVDAGLEEHLAAELHSLGIDTSTNPVHAQFSALAADAEEKLSLVVQATAAEEPRRATTPTTIEDWREADRLLTGFLLSQIDGGRGISDRAWARYFGSKRVADEVMRELARWQPFVSLAEWYYADYRATKKSKTLLERLRDDRTTTSLQRSLIEARMAARLSIYRIDAAEPGSHLSVEDIFDGTRLKIQERAFSGCGVEGLFVPMRVVRNGDWNFMFLAGPPITAFQISRVIAYLQVQGVELSTEGLRRSAHMLGRVWELMLERNSPRTRLQNTDGDPFEWQTATFKVGDTKAVEAALRARSDLEYDAVENVWVWSRPGFANPALGDNTILGRLEPIDDRLMLEVNSKARLERARAWIERIPGVTFERASARDAADDAPPLDDQLRSKPVTDEFKRKIERIQLETCRRWLDTPVPELGGLTPRKACATAAGRHQVGIMIRTMPPMGIPGGSIPVPREELLRELGLSGTR